MPRSPLALSLQVRIRVSQARARARPGPLQHAAVCQPRQPGTLKAHWDHRKVDSGTLHRRSFNAQEAKDNGGVVERERGRAADGGAVFVLNGKQRFRNGYLQRSIAIRSLIILSSVPPLDELQRYKQVSSVP